ncbi:sialate O-acetylesterase [Crateriforma spongiae]|uniref:sialate O-acetylesterase n=1 Tax=Crateriforma spongiae TaxID=2724528 RepID=UPI001F3B1BBC|nr:sialate O-acetylesterase [Crateriforma spongiae]
MLMICGVVIAEPAASADRYGQNAAANVQTNPVFRLLRDRCNKSRSILLYDGDQPAYSVAFFHAMGLHFMFRTVCFVAFLVTVVVVTVNLGTPCEAADYDVYLLAGQSNMDGRGRVSELPAEDQRSPMDRVIIFYRNVSGSSDGWQSLMPGFSIPPKYKGELPSPTFGPEIGFAHSMMQRHPDRQFALIKGSKGGTSLRADWKPGIASDPESQGPRYRDFIETIRMATQQLIDRGDQFQFRALLWHQGESDAKSKTETYQQQLTHLIQRIREDVGVADLPVVVGEVFDNGQRDNVRAATQAVAADHPGVALVSSEGTTTSDPGTHFDAPSQLLLGKRYAEAMNVLLADQP